MLKDVIGFERVAGGAPANVAASVAKLSGNAYFISQLGEDAFGDHIIDVLRDANVNTDYIMRTNKDEVIRDILNWINEKNKVNKVQEI